MNHSSVDTQVIAKHCTRIDSAFLLRTRPL